jgi:hypothetical protein
MRPCWQPGYAARRHCRLGPVRGREPRPASLDRHAPESALTWPGGGLNHFAYFSRVPRIEAVPITGVTDSPRLKLRRGFRFAFIGLFAGFLGLGMAAYRMSVESDQPPRPKTKEISDVLSDTIKKTVDKFRQKQPTPSPLSVSEAWSASNKLGLAASIFGFIGAAFGCVSWLVGEHRRWTWAALCVGIAALAWTHVVVAVSIAVALAIGLWILSHMS